MTMTDADLAEIVTQLRQFKTDTKYVEAKKSEKELPKRLWESLSSFGNQLGGGVIILGLDETSDFTATGVKDIKKIQDALSSQCDQMEPPLRPLVEIHKFEGVELIVAEIAEVPDDQKPCHYRGSGLYTGSRVRVGDGNREMTQYEVNAILENRGQPRYDLEIVQEASSDQFDSELIGKFLNRVRSRRPRLRELPDTQLLEQMGVINTEGQVTLAGLLCFSINPQRWFPSLTITFIHYPGDTEDELGSTGDRFLDNRRFDGPLPHALDDALTTIVREMKKRNLIDGLIRKEIPEYPIDAVREALVNAAVHRDLSKLARGTQIQIQMFQSRLEIRNPGGLFGPVNEENIGQPGVQAARNQHLIQILEELGPAENRGSGISTILRATREARIAPPEIKDGRTYFRIVFSNASMLDEETLSWLNDYKDYDISERQRLSLAYVYRQGDINNHQYCRLTGVESRNATDDLRRLVDLGIFESEGLGRWTYYSLRKEPSSPATSNSTNKSKSVSERHDRIVKYIKGKGCVPPADIANDLSIPRRTVTGDLKRLLEEDRIEKLASSPKDRNVKYRIKAR